LRTRYYIYSPHSAGNRSVGDLLLVNSVPNIIPKPRICSIGAL
jgi:hypothetical protein